jgi:hypothetical protein
MARERQRRFFPSDLPQLSFLLHTSPHYSMNIMRYRKPQCEDLGYVVYLFRGLGRFTPKPEVLSLPLSLSLFRYADERGNRHVDQGEFMRIPTIHSHLF